MAGAGAVTGWGNRSGPGQGGGGAGALEGMVGDYRTAIARFEEALALRRQAGESFGIARGLHLLGMAWYHAGDYDRAAQILGKALDRYGMPDDEFGKSWLCLAINELAAVLAARGDAERAIALGETVLAQQRELGNQLGISLALYFLGRVRRLKGDLVGAAATYREGLALLIEQGEARHHAPYVPSFLLGLAILAAAEGQPERAITLAAAGTALRAPADIRPFPLARAALEHALTTARAALGEAAFAVAWERGAALSIDQAVMEALAHDQGSTAVPVRETPRGRPEPAAPELTCRELDVLRLIVEGRTDQEIARTLYLSRRTVTSYVTNILGKLCVPSRSAAAAEAVRRGLA